jgi:hypothetical protein
LGLPSALSSREPRMSGFPAALTVEKTKRAERRMVEGSFILMLDFYFAILY